MDNNNHHHIDILKMDIEGAAIKVFDNILSDKIYPNQIVTEFEFSEKDDLTKEDELRYKEFEKKLIELINKMKLLNYKCYNMPKFTNEPFHSIEILFVKN